MNLLDGIIAALAITAACFTAWLLWLCLGGHGKPCRCPRCQRKMARRWRRREWLGRGPGLLDMPPPPAVYVPDEWVAEYRRQQRDRP